MPVLLIIFYCISFLAIYVQVFLLVTFFEYRKKISIRTGKILLPMYPSVTIVVPCYNEENAIKLTVDSLLGLEYPKDMLRIIVVDDGSRDRTWNVLEEHYSSHPQISLFKKENGGKHTALNLGIEHATTEFIGCLDSDSSVHPEALKRIMTFFYDPETMAVAPSIVVRNPKNILQYAQRAEYDMAHYTKKMLAFLQGIHVTPGPFSIFRKKVFDELGHYRKAHHTEDQEIALRMHKHGYKIDHCPDAYVYTGSPNTIPKLYKQRVRWVYGFIKNAGDYRDLFFRPEYGSIGMFTLPSGFISISGTIFLLIFLFARVSSYISHKFIQAKAVGLSSILGPSAHFSFDPFYFNTKPFLIISVMLYILVILALINGRRMIQGRKIISGDILLFIVIYSVIGPFWLIKACWNAVWSRETSWTAERDYSFKGASS